MVCGKGQRHHIHGRGKSLLEIFITTLYTEKEVESARVIRNWELFCEVMFWTDPRANMWGSKLFLFQFLWLWKSVLSHNVPQCTYSGTSSRCTPWGLCTVAPLKTLCFSWEDGKVWSLFQIVMKTDILL